MVRLWSRVESYVTTDGQSASLSWNKAPIWGLRPDFYYRQTVADLLMWGALSYERMGLLFTTAAGPRQRIHSRVRVPRDSRTYFTASDSRLPFSSPPTSRRAAMEVFDPASKQEGFYQIIYINSVRTSQETHYVSATKPNRLMLFRETVAVYCENHTEHTDTLCGQNAEF
jgi:hypothetical protein